MTKSKLIAVTWFAALSIVSAGAQPTATPPNNNGRKVEKPINYVLFKPDPLVGDWQGEGGIVARKCIRPLTENITPIC